MKTFRFENVENIDAVENIISERQTIYRHVEFVSWIGGALVLACLQ